MNVDRVVVSQMADGRFEAVPTNATGSPSVGRGASVLEAIGEYAIHHGLLASVTYAQPAMRHEYSIKTKHEDLEFNKQPERD